MQKLPPSVVTHVSVGAHSTNWPSGGVFPQLLPVSATQVWLVVSQRRCGPQRGAVVWVASQVCPGVASGTQVPPAHESPWMQGMVDEHAPLSATPTGSQVPHIGATTFAIFGNAQ